MSTWDLCAWVPPGMLLLACRRPYRVSPQQLGPHHTLEERPPAVRCLGFGSFDPCRPQAQKQLLGERLYQHNYRPTASGTCFDAADGVLNSLCLWREWSEELQTHRLCLKRAQGLQVGVSTLSRVFHQSGASRVVEKCGPPLAQ